MSVNREPAHERKGTVCPVAGRSGGGNFLVLAMACALVFSAGAGEGEIIELSDDSKLHGDLLSVSKESGIQWRHPAASAPFHIDPEYIHMIQFNDPQPVPGAVQPEAAFEFFNGDKIFGELKTLSTDRVELKTWLGDKLVAKRTEVRTISIFSKDFAMLFEGPTGMDGWTSRSRGGGWRYEDRSFVAEGVGTLGRQFDFGNAAAIDFDLSWKGDFFFSIGLFSENITRLDYQSHLLQMIFSTGMVRVQRNQPGQGARSLGHSTIPSMLMKNQIHLSIRADRKEGFLEIWADDELLHKVRDTKDFNFPGNGLVFFAQRSHAPLRISNLRIVRWDRMFPELKEEDLPGTQDHLSLVNRDLVSGELLSIEENRIDFLATFGRLFVPLERVNRIFFAGESVPPPVQGPWAVRADFFGGGSLAFELETWESGEISGHSPNFGHLVFHPKNVNRVQFNLEQQTENDQNEEEAPSDE